MKAPAFPAEENERLKALLSLDVLYSPAEERFDRITRLTRRVFDVPIALVSLVSSDKQWFKSCQGLTATETPRDISFCGHAILQDDVFVVPNALKDPDFCDNPLVTDEPKIRFYAGKPLYFGDYRLGTLCIIDKRPRQLKPQDYDSLKCLGGWVELELMAWSGDKSPLIQQFLELTERETLFDPVTGDLNEKGLALLEMRMQKSNMVQGESFQITARITNLPQNIPQESEAMARKALAQCIRSIVGGRGIIGQLAEAGCSVILENTTKEEAKNFIGDIGEQFVAFLQNEFNLDIAKPVIKLELKKLKQKPV